MEAKIAIVLGSNSDYKKLKSPIDMLDEFNIGYRLEVMSAHRHPDKLRSFCKNVEEKGVEVVIACAGKAAALPGFIASYVNIPVLGVGMKGGLQEGLDALFSIVSVPKGVGLSCTGVGKSAFLNAVIVALEILGLKNKKIRSKLQEFKNKFK